MVVEQTWKDILLLLHYTGRILNVVVVGWIILVGLGTAAEVLRVMIKKVKSLFRHTAKLAVSDNSQEKLEGDFSSMRMNKSIAEDSEILKYLCGLLKAGVLLVKENAANYLWSLRLNTQRFMLKAWISLQKNVRDWLRWLRWLR